MGYKVEVRAEREGESIYGREIVDHDGHASPVYLSPDEIKSAGVNYLQDDFGNVVIRLEREGGLRLFTVQSIDLDWIS